MQFPATSIFRKAHQVPEISAVVRTTKLIPLLVTAVLLFLTGCGSIGPGNVTRDRFGYTHAIAESWKKQMLLNMVKIRYSDSPVFLEVASIISQYGLETELNASFSWNDFLPGCGSGRKH